MASAFLHQLLHSLHSSGYCLLPLLGRVVHHWLYQVANLLLSLVYHSGDWIGSYH